jgi:hypothetical protein
MSNLAKPKMKNKFTISSILNIDSLFRNKNPKNIFKSDNRYLPNNPLNFSKSSTIVTLNYPFHGLTQDDNIIIQNVEGINKILIDSVYLINDFRYMVILIDNQIPSNYKTYTDDLFINIEIVGLQTEKNYISNMPFNYIVGYKKCLIANDIPSDYLVTFKDLSMLLFNSFDLNIINKYCLFVELPFKYIIQNVSSDLSNNSINRTINYEMIQSMLQETSQGPSTGLSNEMIESLIQQFGISQEMFQGIIQGLGTPGGISTDMIQGIIQGISGGSIQGISMDTIQGLLQGLTQTSQVTTQFISTYTDYIKINQTFKISYQHISGIKLGYLNANYPINNINYQSCYQVYNVIDENTFQINTNYMAFSDIFGGGKYVQVMKITNTITGYPDADNYVINLKKTFNNVVGIELISSEFPYIDLTIKKNINDKLYWKHIEDGQVIYKIQLDDGFYTTETLLNKLLENMNNVKRISYSSINNQYNYFDIELEPNTQKITFKPYILTNLPNSLSIRLEVINNEKYYILNVGHRSIVNIEDTITISGSNNVTIKIEQNKSITLYSIDSSYINKIHKIYLINLENETYDIILGKEKEIKTIISTSDSYGGENVQVKNKTYVSFLFDKNDTMGDLLGFRNSGDKFSITDFSSEINNQDKYINSNDLDVVGNLYSYRGGFFNLAGKYNYMLMYLNDIEYIYSNNNLPSAFAKIAFSGNPGDILFNTYVPYPINVYSKNFPISIITDLTVKFIYPDGSPLNFRNLDHSFTLRITEEKIQNSDTHINSQKISVAEAFKDAYTD